MRSRCARAVAQGESCGGGDERGEQSPADGRRGCAGSDAPRRGFESADVSLACRVALADGRTFTGELPAAQAPGDSARNAARSQRRARGARGRATAGRQAADHHPAAAACNPPGPLLARRGRRQDRLARGPARAGRAACEPRRRGVLRARGALRAAPRQACRPPHARIVDRRRPARAATEAVGVSRATTVPSSGRERRQRRGARVLAPARTAGRDPGRPKVRPSWSSRSSARTCGSSITSASISTASRTWPTRSAPNAAG